MKHKYITKINQSNNKTFWVRVPEIIDGIIQPISYQYNSKTFRKGKGTWKAALEKAITWRDDYLKERNALHFLEVNTVIDQGNPGLPLEKWKSLQNRLRIHNDSV